MPGGDSDAKRGMRNPKNPWADVQDGAQVYDQEMKALWGAEVPPQQRNGGGKGGKDGRKGGKDTGNWSQQKWVEVRPTSPADSEPPMKGGKGGSNSQHKGSSSQKDQQDRWTAKAEMDQPPTKVQQHQYAPAPVMPPASMQDRGGGKKKDRDKGSRKDQIMDDWLKERFGPEGPPASSCSSAKHYDEDEGHHGGGGGYHEDDYDDAGSSATGGRRGKGKGKGGAKGGGGGKNSTGEEHRRKDKGKGKGKGGRGSFWRASA